MNHSLHSSDLTRLEQEANWDFESASPKIAPGSLEESTALEKIDVRRDEELSARGDTFAKRRMRARRAWGHLL